MKEDPTKKKVEKRVSIVMLEDKKGSDDGLKVLQYKKGETYEVSESLADNFVNQRSGKPVARLASDVEADEAREEQEKALEERANKAEMAAPVNKSKGK